MHQHPTTRNLSRRRPLPLAPLLLATLFGALIGATCGGDDGGNPTATPTPADASPSSSSATPDAAATPPERAACSVMNGKSCEPGSNPSCRDELMNFVCGCNETDGGARGWLCLPFCGSGPCPAASPIKTCFDADPAKVLPCSCPADGSRWTCVR